MYSHIKMSTMSQELVHHTSPTNMVYYIDEPSPICATPIDATPVENAAHPLDVVSLCPNPIDDAQPQDGIDAKTIVYQESDHVACMSQRVDVRVRNGEHMTEMAKSDTDKINLEQSFGIG